MLASEQQFKQSAGEPVMLSIIPVMLEMQSFEFLTLLFFDEEHEVLNSGGQSANAGFSLRAATSPVSVFPA